MTIPNDYEPVNFYDRKEKNLLFTLSFYWKFEKEKASFFKKVYLRRGGS